MGILGIWLLAAGLAMDCFSVSVASGTLLKRVNLPVFFRMAVFFGLFQGVMPWIGWSAARFFSDEIQSYDHWVAFALLGFLGVRMIVEGLKPEDETRFDPTRLSVTLTLAVATSIDALAVGVTFAFMGYRDAGSLLLPTGIIGIVSLLFSLAGSFIGAMARKLLKFRMEIVGGIVLIGLGTKILLEHLLG